MPTSSEIECGLEVDPNSARDNSRSPRAGRPPGLLYKQVRIGCVQLPWIASPAFQLLIVALVCFLCVGMFNALNGLGGVGLGGLDSHIGDEANTALYSTFAVIGFFAGSIVNRLGVRTSLSLGGLGYSVYVASFLVYSKTRNSAFSVFAGALLGACAGILWSAQGCIMLAYPPEGAKGRYISCFWMIFNFGSVLGSIIPLTTNTVATEQDTVSAASYIGFIILTLCGAGLATTLVRTARIIRPDGSRVVIMRNPSWKTEIVGLWETICSDAYIVLLFPMFFASNWFYTYQFNVVNGAHFNTRTRSLNNLLYWLAQIVAALVFGYFLDLPSLRRSLRVKLAWSVLFVLTVGVWIGGYFDMIGTAGRKETLSPQFVAMDWKSPDYTAHVILYICYGFYDASWQTCVYYFIGSLTNNGRKLANLAGFYKSLQSAGAAVVWHLDGIGMAFDVEFYVCWGLLGGSLLLAAPVIFAKVTDHVSLEDDVKFSDATVDEVRGNVASVSIHRAVQQRAPGRSTMN